eukprot:441164_1
MPIETEFHKLFSNVLGRSNCRLLFHTCPSISTSTKDMIDFLENSGRPRIPGTITKGIYKFHHLYYINNFAMLYSILQHKMFSSNIGAPLRNLIIKISKEHHVDTVQQLVSEVIGKLFIDNEKENYEKISTKNKYIARVCRQNSSLKTIENCMKSVLSLSIRPSIPSYMNLVSQAIVGIDFSKDVFLLQFDAERIAIDLRNDMFVLTASSNLLHNCFGSDDMWDEQDTYIYTSWMYDNLDSTTGAYDISYKRKDVSLRSVKGWSKIQVAQYKAHRKKLKKQLKKQLKKKKKKKKLSL